MGVLKIQLEASDEREKACMKDLQTFRKEGGKEKTRLEAALA